jgi:diacylglycerol kinase family enzyme
VAHRVQTRDRIAAATGLVLGLIAAGLAVHFAVTDFPRGVLVAFSAALCLALGWYGLVGAGPARFLGLGGFALVFAAAVILVIRDGELFEFLALAAVLAAGAASSRKAFKVRVPLPDAPDPAHPVLFFNPKSGGGKAVQLSLADEAASRGIEAVEMEPGCDLERLARDAVEAGADALAMAGGDGSQAVIAAVAAEHDLPYACVPAGTRNHFALDLGVDREDVVGALDAFVGGGERRVDLAEVNGRVFVNNVSLGVYADAVQRDGYREAKLRTLLEAGAEVLDPESPGSVLEWKSPSGRRHSSGAAILVSNNLYRLGGALGSGTRPRIDDGELGVTVFADPFTSGRRLRQLQRPWRQWSTPTFEVLAREPVAAGIDGESATVDPPLRFAIRPAVLRVRIARAHPGASPSAAMPDGFLRGMKSLVLIAAGRPPVERASTLEAPRPDGKSDRG